MKIALENFNHASVFLDRSIYLGENQQIKIGSGKIIRYICSYMQSIKYINQLPRLQQQHYQSMQLTNALLLSVAQEYGTEAAREVNSMVNNSSPHKALSGHKLRYLIDTIKQLYYPLAQTKPLAPSITNIIFNCTKKSDHQINSCSNLIKFFEQIPRKYGKQTNSRALIIHSFLHEFFSMQDIEQKRIKNYLYNWLYRNKKPKKQFLILTKLAPKELKAIYKLIRHYNTLPNGNLNTTPLAQNTFNKSNSIIQKFSQLPINQQLSIAGWAAASVTGYNLNINTTTQKLLSLKGIGHLAPYFSHALANKLIISDPKLQVHGDHFYSKLGLSAHFVIKDDMHDRELALVLGGFRSHPTIIGKLQQLKAILNNLLYAPISTSPMYKEVATLALNASIYAKNHGFTRFSVVGHSLGSSLGEYALAQHPKMIDEIRLFQPLHAMGRNCNYLIKEPKILDKIIQIIIDKDLVIPNTAHKPLKKARVIELPRRHWGYKAHSAYDKILFKAAIANLTKLTNKQYLHTRKIRNVA